MAIAFLPVRLFFYPFITPNWLGNLGMMTAIALLMFYLTKENKLGKFGVYFKNRIRRFTRHKIFYLAFIGPLISITIYVWILYEVENVEDRFKYERDILITALIYFLSNNNDTSSIFKDNPIKNLDTSGLPERFKPLVPMIKGTNLIKNIQEYNLYPSSTAMFEYAYSNCSQRMELIDKVFQLNGATGLDAIIEMGHFYEFLLGNFFYLANVVSGTWMSHIIAVWIICGEFEGSVIEVRKHQFNEHYDYVLAGQFQGDKKKMQEWMELKE